MRKKTNKKRCPPNEPHGSGLDVMTSRIVKALRMAAPLCLATRYKYWPRCCVEASGAGAGALRRLGVEAYPISLIGVCMKMGAEPKVCWLGATAKESFDIIGPNAPMSFEDYERHFQAQCPAELTDELIHMAVLVQGTAILDLTTAQITEAAGIVVPGSFLLDLPNAIPVRSETIPRPLEVENPDEGLVLRYYPKNNIDQDAIKYTNEGLTQDLLDVMTLALACGLEPSAFKRVASKVFVAGP